MPIVLFNNTLCDSNNTLYIIPFNLHFNSISFFCYNNVRKKWPLHGQIKLFDLVRLGDQFNWAIRLG
jgi:hypothetical protein